MIIESTAHLWQLDARLAALGRGVGVMRLRVGDLLGKLESIGGIHALGFPTLDSYAREALGRSGRWAGDTRALARRLQPLPALRAALVDGSLTTSMVELVARVATPEDEVAWVSRARVMTVRAMRVHLKTTANVSLSDDSPLPRTSLTLTVTRLEAVAFERARAMVEAVGAARGDEAIEAMLAEGLGELLARDADLDLPLSIGGVDLDARAARAELALLHEQAEAAAESAVPPEDADPIVLEVPAAADIEGLAAIDAALRAMSTNLAARDVELARLSRQAQALELWRVLRFASFDHYCRERIGLSPSSIATRIAMARRLDRLPVVADALVAGRIGYEAATLVARVAAPTTVHAWLERASERTVKHLREDIEAVELLARLEQRDPRQMQPPSDDLLEAARSVERAALQIVTGTNPPESNETSNPMSDPSPEQMSGAEGLPTTTLRVAVSAEVASFWRGLEGLHEALSRRSRGEARAIRMCAEGGSFVAFLVRAVTRTWADSLPPVAYADIYARDRWRCASPVCRSRNVTPHHILYRARGGGEHPGNLVSLCAMCHLELVHNGHLKVAGDATDLAWHAAGWHARGRVAQLATH